MRAWLLENPTLSTLILSSGMLIVGVAIVAFAYSFNKAPDK